MIDQYLIIIFMVVAVRGIYFEVPPETVKAGEFTYYNITYDSYVYLQLTSLSGDCDLYVSETKVFPTYEDYSICSATCGEDSVIIPKRFKRRAHIGVFGHPSFESSVCSLSLCFLQHPDNPDEFVDEMMEISLLTESVLQEACGQERNQRGAVIKTTGEVIRTTLDILGRTVTALATMITASEPDGVMFQLFSLFI